MSMEYPTSSQEAREVLAEGTSQPTTTEREQTTELEQQAPQDVHQQIQDIAIQIGEDPAKIAKRRDIASTLERMKDGIIVTLHISRPRFWSKLTLDDLGLTAGNTLATSEAANRVLNDYFRLGRRSLLPKEYQDKLNLAETSARQCIARYSFKSHWGAFVPLTMYPQWKEENALLEAEFWKAREEIVGNYEAITEQVVEESRPLAEDAWRRVTFGTVLRNHEDDTVTREVIEGVIARLQMGEGKERFVENYLACIRAAMPKKWEIEDGFSYEVERAVVPLPSLLARDMEQADRIYQERALKDAKTRAELEAIEVQRRAEMEKLNLQQQQERWQQQREREQEYERVRQERERQRLQWEMEHDVLIDARRQKDRLVTEFYTGVVQQINTCVLQVTENIMESLDNNSGIIKGRVSLQLTNLVKQLETMNFVEDEQIESQLARLRAVLPSADEKEKASKGLARINTTRISQVVRAIHEEAEHLQIDLGTQPRTRGRRSQPLLQQPVSLDARRKTRAGSALAEVTDQPQSTVPETTETPKRRRQKRTV